VVGVALFRFEVVEVDARGLGDAGDVQDPDVVRLRRGLEDAGEESAGEEEGREDVHLKRELAPVPGELALGAAREDARVVREEVQRGVVVEDVAGEAADVVEGGEVADVRRGDAAAGAGRGVDASGRGVEAGAIATVQDDRVAGRREATGGVQPDAVRAPRDQSHARARGGTRGGGREDEGAPRAAARAREGASAESPREGRRRREAHGDVFSPRCVTSQTAAAVQNISSSGVVRQ
jgi:hypothetical protein